MWIWIVSLIVLIACLIFAWRMMVSNFNLLSNDKKFSMFKNFTPSDLSYLQETLRTIKSKMKTIEDQNAYYELQFNKIQEKLNLMSSGKTQPVTSSVKEKSQDEEDWKELFYEENEKKEKLENELDAAQQELESLKEEMESMKKDSGEFSTLKSDYDARLNDIQSMQNTILELQRELEASVERGKELEIQLQKEARMRQQSSQTESEYVSLKSENEGLKRQITEMAIKQAEVEKKLMKFNELESKVNVYEEEKTRMIADLELMIQQTRVHKQ
ncbi:MAG: hypothetical protein J0H55_09960 [Chitinophagaceae bacterium]|nr:hypothetical protein [Chitinophagaceae bacterium]